MNDVSPVTESAVRDFASRIISTIVSHSAQAQQIKDLAAAVEQSQQQIAALRSDSERVGRELAEAYQLVTVAEQERDQAKSMAAQAQASLEQKVQYHSGVVNDYENRLQQAHDALAQRDQRIAQLEQEMASVKSQRDMALSQQEQTEISLRETRDSLNYQRSRSHDLETELTATNAKAGELERAKDKAETTLKEVQERIRSLFEPAKPTDPEVPVHRSWA